MSAPMTPADASNAIRMLRAFYRDAPAPSREYVERVAGALEALMARESARSGVGDGGPAYPVTESDGMGNPILTSAGMTLRDYFAAKAMQSAITTSNGPWIFPDKTDIADHVAAMAYQVADAMLKARSA